MLSLESADAGEVSAGVWNLDVRAAFVNSGHLHYFRRQSSQRLSQSKI